MREEILNQLMKCIFNQFILSGVAVKRPDVITEYLVSILKLDEGNPGFGKKKSGIYSSQKDTFHGTTVHQKRLEYFNRYDKRNGRGKAVTNETSLSHSVISSLYLQGHSSILQRGSIKRRRI